MSNKSAAGQFHKIHGIEVTGGFLDNMRLEFGESLNCVIGGRGTGKTTVLELMRWALDQMPDQRGSLYRNIDRLIQANLGTGQVTVDVETLDGIHYRVQRDYGNEPVVSNDKGDAVEIDIGRGTIFAAEIYSQNQIEEIANEPLFQLNLIDKFVTDRINDLNAKVRTGLRELDANATDIMKLRNEITGLKEKTSELPEVAEKLKAFKIKEEDEGAIALKKESQAKVVREQEKMCLKTLHGVFARVREDLENIVEGLPDRVGECFDDEVLKGPNGKFFTDIKTLAEGSARDVLQNIEEVARLLASAGKGMEQKAGEVTAVHARQEKAYRDLLAKYEEEKDKAKERDQLLRRQVELQTEKKKLEKKSEELRKSQNLRSTLLRGLSDLQDERHQAREAVAQRITEELAPTIRVRIEQFGNTDAYRDLLRESMKGSGVRYTQLVDRIVQRIPPHEFAAIVLRADAQALMDHLELDADRANRIILQLKDSNLIYDIEVVELHDRPTIELKDGPDYKDSGTLSTGQKCTTILPILLLESASPLLVDQPEDNLDNAFVYETVVKSVRGVCGRRQLIFVTHNPNIPVLGNAERVFVLESTGRRASLKATGTVDDVKDEVETIMEGGKEAFQQRKARYGY